jgi:hypothetical protein
VSASLCVCVSVCLCLCVCLCVGGGREVANRNRCLKENIQSESFVFFVYLHRSAVNRNRCLKENIQEDNAYNKIILFSLFIYIVPLLIVGR